MTRQLEGSTLKRRIGTGLLGGALLTLAACGDDRDALTDAREAQTAVDTSTSTTEITMSYDEDAVAAMGDESIAETLRVVSSSGITVDMVSDVANKQHEMDINVSLGTGGMNLDLNLPVFMNEESGEIYTGVEDIVNLVSFIMPMEVPSEAQGKVVNLTDMADEEDAAERPLQGIDSAESAKVMNDIMSDYLSEQPDDSVTFEDDVYTQTINGDDFVKYMLTELAARDVITAEERDEAISELPEQLSIGDIIVTTTLNDDGLIATETVAIPLHVTDEELFGAEGLTLTLNADMTYHSYNEPVEFVMDVSEDNVLSTEEFEGLMNNIAAPMPMPEIDESAE